MKKTGRQPHLSPLVRLVVLVLILTFPSLGISGDTTGTAGKNWKKYKTPEEAGFSSSKLQEARAFWENLRPAAAAIMVIYKGKVLVDWGDTKSPYMCHSIRKSFLSALYGNHVEEGSIGLQKTMEELGIDDVPPLTHAEKQAKVIHLLKARSGIYHEAAYESQGMKDLRPVRGSHPPDTFWYYNNWDFNVLGTIFIQETGIGIFEEFKAQIADPIGMQDFSLDLCYYHYEWDLSIHPAYPFQMSARDRARFGRLFLQDGLWDDTRIISRNWIRKSTRAYSDASFGIESRKGLGYGFMWWTIAGDVPYFQEFDHLKDMGAGYYAAGYGGHVIVILPEREMVFVQVVDTFQGLQVSGDESYTLLDKIFAARDREIFDLSALKTWFDPKLVSRGDQITFSARVKNLSRKTCNPSGVDFFLSADERLNARDVHIGYTELPGIKYKKKRNATLNTIILDTVEPGEYYVIARVDRDNVNLDPWPKNSVVASKKKLVLK